MITKILNWFGITIIRSDAGKITGCKFGLPAFTMFVVILLIIGYTTGSVRERMMHECDCVYRFRTPEKETPPARSAGYTVINADTVEVEGVRRKYNRKKNWMPQECYQFVLDFPPIMPESCSDIKLFHHGTKPGDIVTFTHKKPSILSYLFFASSHDTITARCCNSWLISSDPAVEEFIVTF